LRTAALLLAHNWSELLALLLSTNIQAFRIASQRRGFPISVEELAEVVAKNDKQRFSFDETGVRIRANQGHSTEVDLQLEPQTPPDVLYHGTAVETLDIIRRTGVKRMARHHVHLSTTVPAARDVGRRHGTPVVLRVDAAGMHRAGILFYVSDNGVWLVDEVPPQYLDSTLTIED
jgi:putative RNA 2'-phosphotransferase